MRAYFLDRLATPRSSHTDIARSPVHESGTLLYDPIDAAVELAIYDVLTTPAAKHYVLQTANELGTLGQSRGKINLLRRFDLYNLSSSYEDSIPGTHFSPSKPRPVCIFYSFPKDHTLTLPANWVVNGPSFNITLNETSGLTAYMEDFYNILSPNGSSAALNIQWKLNATLSHLRKATLPDYADSLFWSFASSEYDADVPVSTPEIMALGSGSEYTPTGGVNQHLVPFFRNMTGKRLGIVMFDFFDKPSDLVQSFLDVQQK